MVFKYNKKGNRFPGFLFDDPFFDRDDRTNAYEMELLVL